MSFKETARPASFTKSMAFRTDSSPELVTITEFNFHGCKFLSKGRFVVGENLRLHIRGQGLIAVKVHWTSGSTSGVTFLTECAV